MRNFKRLLVLISVLVLSVACLTLVACGDVEDENKINVTYYMKEGDAPLVTSIDIGSTFDFSQVPSRSHYKFLGMYDEQGGMIVDANGKGTVVLNSDVTLYARWQNNVYTINFDADGGNFVGSAGSPITAAYGTQLAPLPVVEKLGFEFLGWYSGSTRVTKGAEFVSGAEEFVSSYYNINGGEVNLVAKYDVKKLEVIFEYNDGENDQKVIEVGYGEKIPEDEFPELDTGSRMVVGWTTVPNGNVKFDGEITQSITLFPIWKNYKMIEFYVSPEDDEPDDVIQVFEGDSLTPYIPEKAGYEFDGWYSSTLFNGIPENAIHYSLVSNKLYAKWNLAEYVLNFVTGTNDVITSITYTMESELELPKYEKENFTFLGWCAEEDFSDTPITEIKKGTHDITTLYAKFKGDDKKVVLNAGSGKVSSTEKTVEYYKNYTLPIPVYDGYEFQGWFSGEGDDAVQITDKKGESLAIWSKVDDSTTLYAKYKQKYYVTVTPNLDSAGTFEVEDYYVTGDKVSLTASANTGYRVLGWFKDDVLISSSLTYEFMMGEENIDLELRFAALEFTVSFNAGDGVCKTVSTTVSYGDKYELPVAYKQGYLFKGWKYDGKLVTDDEGVGLNAWKYTTDIELVAEYEEDESGATMIFDADGLLSIKDTPDGYFVIVEDIDLSGYDWVPFEFSGTLLGNDCIIKNLKLESDSGNLGMFTKITGTVKDLVFENISVTSNSYESVLVGGLCAELAGGNVSGIEMRGTVTGDFCRIGGIVGKMTSGSIKNCKNYATVKSETYETSVSAGGIVSVVDDGEVSGCENFGAISINQHCGGVVGISYSPKLSELKNSGTVSGKNIIGGVVGYFEETGSYTLTGFKNTGVVTGEEKVGGVIGNLVNHAGWNGNDTTYNLKLVKFTNEGAVTGTKYTGGVIGYLTAYIDGSYSDGSAIITVNSFENKANVTGTLYVGGLIGYAYSDNGASKLATSKSSGIITAEAYVGGLAGRLENVKLVDSSNEGSTVKATYYSLESSAYYAYVGGYVGYGYYVENCHNKSAIIYEDRGSYVGGIAGRLQNPIKNCTNTAAITAEEASYVGGLVGELTCTGNYDVVQLTNSGAVKGKSYVGGIVGHLVNHASWNSNDATYNLKITKLVNSGAVDGEQQVGGLIGRLYAAITGNYSDGSAIITSSGLENTAAINGINYVGGLVGYAYSDNGGSQIIASKSSGAITAEAYVGGLAGMLENVKLISSSNEGATVKASYYVIDGTSYYAYFGGYVGYGYYVENCHNKAEIVYTERGNYVGGVAGRLLNAMKNCSNTAKVSAENSNYVGGLVGELSCAASYEVIQLTNSGAVSGKDYVGGCIGALTNHAGWNSNNSTYNLKLGKFVNSGAVVGKQQVGGCIGRLYTAITGNYSGGSVVIVANGFENTAAVTAVNYAGGLIGYAYSDNGSSQIASSKSSGAITAEAYVGGIAGRLENVKLVDSSNAGSTVTATYYLADGDNHYAYVGGYVGWGYYIENCENAVNITYTEDGMYIGGLAGRLSNSMKNCKNTAAITAEKSNYVGGVVGDLDCFGTYEVASITNSGAVKGHNFVGGLFGRINNWNGGGSSNDTHYTIKLNKFNNTGEVTANDYVGGCIGYVHCLVNGNYSDGSVTLSANDMNNNANVTGGVDMTRVAGLIGEITTDNGNSILTDYECKGLINGVDISTAGEETVPTLLVAVKSNFTLRQ